MTKSRRQAGLFIAAAVFALSGVAAAETGDLDRPFSPFGIGNCHVNGRSVADFERWMPPMQAIGITVQRTPHCHWGALEPKPGEWNWANLDAQMDYLD